MSKATLYVWLPTVLYPAGLGHAALQLRTATGKEYYITWLAGGKGPKKAAFPSSNGTASLRVQMGGKWTLNEDKKMMKRYGMAEPNWTIELPALVFKRRKGRSFLHHGVDVEQIVQFWENRRLTMESYTLLSTKENCTGCVVEALRAGGLDNYLKHPNNWFVQDARTLLTWANGAMERIKLANERQQKIDSMMETLVAKHLDWVGQIGTNLIGTIPSLQEWKTESDQKLSFRAVARRIEQVKRLDRLIEEYHKTNDRLIRLGCLVKMLTQIALHLTLKPNSDRRLAVERLGVRTYFAFWDLLMPGDSDSDNGIEDVRRRSSSLSLVIGDDSDEQPDRIIIERRYSDRSY
jgi:hypothetical protein